MASPARKHHAFVVGSRVCLVDQDLVNTFVKNPNHLANIVEACQKNQPVGSEQVFILSAKTPETPQVEGALPSMLNVQVTTAKCPPPVLGQIVNAAKSVKQLNKPNDVWTENCTRFLLKLCKENYQLLESDENAEGETVWETIAQKINENYSGSYSAMHCKSKWKAMVSKYQEDKETGVGGAGVRYYSEVEEIINLISGDGGYDHLDMEVTGDGMDFSDDGINESMIGKVVPVLTVGAWTEAAILQLILIYKDNKDLFPYHSPDGVMWRGLANRMKEKGYNFTGEEAEKKWKELLSMYNTFKEKQEEPSSKHQFAPFYAAMFECMEGMPSLQTESDVDKWNKSSVMSLISAYKKHQFLFIENASRPEGWRKIRDELRSAGHMFTVQEISEKWKKLLARYKACVLAGTHRKIPIYQEMHKLLQGNKDLAAITSLHRGDGDGFTSQAATCISSGFSPIPMDEPPEAASPPPMSSPSLSFSSDDDDELFDMDVARDADVLAGNIAATLQKIHSERLAEDRKLRKSLEKMHDEKIKMMTSIIEMLKELKK